MAYLGAIARTHTTSYTRLTQAGAAVGQLGGKIVCLGNRMMASSYRYNPTTVRSAVSGYVYENGVAAARTVRVYRRDTGEMLRQTVSAIDGSYYMSLGYSGEVVLIAFDAAGAPVLNAAVADYVVPT